MANVQTVPRVFVVSGTRIPDPAPNVPLEEALRLLSINYPQFRWTKVFEEDGVIVENELVFTLQLPPPKVNG